MLRRAPVFALLAAVAWARPPASEGFERMDRLRADLATRLEELRKQEEFDAKPLEERLAILLEASDPKAKVPLKYEKVDITPEKVAKQILEWTEVQNDAPTPAAVRALDHLLKALHKRYGDPAVVDFNRNERYNVSRLLVKELNSRYAHLRVACFEMLKDIYRNVNGLYYQPNAVEKARKDKQRDWESYIKREKR